MLLVLVLSSVALTSFSRYFDFSFNRDFAKSRGKLTFKAWKKRSNVSKNKDKEDPQIQMIPGEHYYLFRMI